MGKNIIFTIILLLCFFLNKLITVIIKDSPGIVSGLKLGNTENERKRNEEWVQILYKSIERGNYITLFGCVLSIILGSDAGYYCFLSFPLVIAICYSYWLKKGNNNHRIGIKYSIIILILFLIPFVFIFFSCRDLSIDIKEQYLNINGLYGKQIYYKEIREIEKITSLPSMKIRTNGFALGTTLIGHFKTIDNQYVILYCHSKNHFIKIVSKKNEVYYLSCKDSLQTNVIFSEIKNEENKFSNE